jgi:serine protease AprX
MRRMDGTARPANGQLAAPSRVRAARHTVRTLGVVVALALGITAAAPSAFAASYYSRHTPSEAHPSSPAASADTHVIVRAQAGDIAKAKHAVIDLGGTIGVDLGIVNGFAATVPTARVTKLVHSPYVASVTSDSGAKLTSSSYSPVTDAGSPAGVATDIGSKTYWNAGFTGQGIGVALIDSGVSPVDGLSDPGKVFYGPDFTPTGYFSQVRGLDTLGHGTFMAGLIAGKDTGAATPYQPQSGTYLGTAPDAHIISVKVADAAGDTTESAVIAAIGWVVQHRNDPGLNIRVLNLSLGVRTDAPYTSDPLAAAAEAAWKSGIVVVAAAGNDGKVGLLSPASDPYVIAVGAVNTNGTASNADDTVASFSNLGDGVRNPDFGTVGTHIVGLRDPGSAIDLAYGSGAGSVNARLMRGSGTSEATAITSGAVALLLSQRPWLTPNEAKATLKVHATWMANLTPQSIGQGELNLNWAFNAATETGAQDFASASNGSLNLTPLDARASTTPAGSTWTGAHWTGAHWTGAHWTGATWTGATWTGAAWTGATWTGATWTGAAWTGAAWTGATWTSAMWQTFAEN